MIKEAYVSYEVAKLLKEKGFDEECWHWYEDEDSFIHSNDDYGYQSNSDHISKYYECSAPTHQMACAWLRETYNIHIEFSCNLDDNYKVVWTNSIWTTDEKELYCLSSSENYFPYEESVEEALKDILENLI